MQKIEFRYLSKDNEITIKTIEMKDLHEIHIEIPTKHWYILVDNDKLIITERVKVP